LRQPEWREIFSLLESEQACTEPRIVLPAVPDYIWRAAIIAQLGAEEVEYPYVFIT